MSKNERREIRSLLTTMYKLMIQNNDKIKIKREIIENTKELNALNSTKLKENLLSSNSTSGKQLINESREDQKIKASKWINKELKLGDKWYLINSDWYTRWANYIGIQLNNDNESIHLSNHQQQNQMKLSSYLSPDKINNKTLLNSDNQLKSQLTEEVDYYPVCEELWNYLVHLYSTTAPEVSLYSI